jgi:hypothetical protein
MSKLNKRLVLEIQLKEYLTTTEELKEKFNRLMAKNLKIDFEVILFPYREFQYGMGLDYERKFQFMYQCRC